MGEQNNNPSDVTQNNNPSNITQFRVDRIKKLKDLYSDEPSRDRRYNRSSKKAN